MSRACCYSSGAMCLFMLPPSVVLFILTMLWVTVRAEQPLGARPCSTSIRMYDDRMTQVPARLSAHRGFCRCNNALDWLCNSWGIPCPICSVVGTCFVSLLYRCAQSGARNCQCQLQFQVPLLLRQVRSPRRHGTLCCAFSAANKRVCAAPHGCCYSTLVTLTITPKVSALEVQQNV